MTLLLVCSRQILNFVRYDHIFPIGNENYDQTMKSLVHAAKQKLRSRFTYFMLLEEQRLSQYLFEHTFGIKFNKKFTSFLRIDSIQ